jgi:4-amino-4-deoxy-L-arabinose transferase-like glycosyltransferase
LIAIVIVALVTRVFCYLELAASPCFWWHEWSQTDMNTFHSWGLAIAGGDWWFETAGPPLHHWHRQIAADYARMFPGRWAGLTAADSSDDPDAAARALWYRWCGGRRTYQGPMYPYLIALTYSLLGPAAGWVFAWQMLLGVVSIVLVHVVTRRYFGELAALVAAGLVLLYGPLLFYEFALLRAALIVLFGLLLVYLLDRAHQRRTALAWLGVGVSLSLSLALKAHFMLMALAAVGLLVGWCWKEWRQLGRCAGGFVLGLLIGFSPVVVRNVVVGAPPLVTATSGPPTFLVSNARDSAYASWGIDYGARVLGETNCAFLPTLIATLKTHPTVASYLRLLGAKVLATWHWYEVPNNANSYYGELHSRVLRVLPVSFGIIGPLAIVGAVLALRRFGRCAPLYFLMVTNLVVLYFFFAFARFRLPLAAGLAPFAGLTMAGLVRFLCARRWGAAGATLVACGLLALFTLSPLVAGQSLVRRVDADVGYRVFYGLKVRLALAEGDLDTAAEVLGESLDRQPAEVRALGPTRPARGVTEAELGSFYAEIYRRHAEVLQRAGRSTEAAEQLQRAAELWQACEALLPGAPQ